MVAVKARLVEPGRSQLIDKLQRIANIAKTMEKPTEQSLELLQTYMQDYPSPPAGSTYERTGDLGDGWEADVIMRGNDLGIVYNNTDYGPYVQGDGSQAEIHEGRWQTNEEAIKDNIDAIAVFFEKHVNRELAK